MEANNEHEQEPRAPWDDDPAEEEQEDDDDDSDDDDNDDDDPVEHPEEEEGPARNDDGSYDGGVAVASSGDPKLASDCDLVRSFWYIFYRNPALFAHHFFRFSFWNASSLSLISPPITLFFVQEPPYRSAWTRVPHSVPSFSVTANS